MQFFLRKSLDTVQAAAWNNFVLSTPRSHFLQSPAWADVDRSRIGIHTREPLFFWAEEGGKILLTALAVKEKLSLPGKYIYHISKGPVFGDTALFEECLPKMISSMSKDALEVQISPYWELLDGGDDLETTLERFGFNRRRVDGMWATLRLDLTDPEDMLFQTLHHSTRRNIRKGQQAGMLVRHENNPEGWTAFVVLQQELSERNNIEPKSYDEIAQLSKVWLRDGEHGTLLIARYKNRPVGGVIITVWNRTAFYWAGASSRAVEGLRTNHFLFWEAILWAKNKGCEIFDMGGFSLVARPHDELWGINTFKKGFAPDCSPTKYVANHVFIPNMLLSLFWNILKKYKRR